MSDTPSHRPGFFVRHRRRFLAALVALAVLLLLAIFALPIWLKSAAEDYVADNTGHRLQIAKIRFDPLALALHVEGLTLDQPDGQPLLAFRELLVDLSSASAVRRAWVFDAIRLDAPQAWVALVGRGRLNWSDFLDALKSEDERPDDDDGQLPRLDIEQLVLAGGQLDFTDATRSPAFATRFDTLELELANVSTLPDEQGQHRFAAQTAFGARIDWRGSFTLSPLAAEGSIGIEDMALGKLAPYLRTALRIAPPEGTARLAGDYRVAYADSRFDATFDHLALGIEGLVLQGESDAAPGLALAHVELKDGRVELAPRKLVIGEIGLRDGRLALMRHADGRLNVEDWLVPPAAPAADEKAEPDAAATPPPADAAGAWQLALGRVSLADFALKLDDRAGKEPRVLDVGRLALDFQADARVGGTTPAVDVRAFNAGIDKLALTAGKHPPLILENLALADGRLDLAAREVTVGRVALDGGRAAVVRRADGSLPLLAALGDGNTPLAKAGKAADTKADKRDAPKESPGWRYRVGEITLADFETRLRDEGVSPPAEFTLNRIAARIENLSEDMQSALPLSASLDVASGGRLEASGRITPATAAGQLELKLTNLALKPAQPYLAQQARLELAAGRLSAQGKLALGGKEPVFRGGFRLDGLRVVEEGTRKVFVAWKSLGTRSLGVTPRRLDIAELTLDGLDTVLVIHEDKTVNVTKVLKAPDDAGAPAPKRVAAPTDRPASPFLVNIERLRLRDGELDFSDLSLALPFGTRIHKLSGSINGLSSRAGAPGQVELDGQVDDYGLARAVGQVDFFAPTAFMDLKVVFRNVEMARLTPYTATFAGRRVDSGKLSLDLEYKIDQRQLHGDNQVVMEKLVLGERIEAPGARDLPLDLAIAILQDSEGRIDLGLPISGSLDDPQFSYGALVWKALVNVITKIATAPFRALGALLGGGDKFEEIAFEPGMPGLTPPEREKLTRLAGALTKRPGLALTVHGPYAEADRVALQDRQLRRTLAARAGLGSKDEEDPGPLSTRQPKVQEALEKLFAERAGAGELAALKEGFRKANPGELQESAAGKMMSRLSGAFREKRVLGEQEIAQLKGADFHGVLYERLRRGEDVPDARLVQLATARGEAFLAALTAAGAPAERIEIAPPEKAEDPDGRDVPVKLELGTAKNQP